ncbi:MAG: hypothetical protein VB817_11370, partial [Pirellulaceae bacterium]
VGDELMFAADRGTQDFSYPNNWLHARLPATLHSSRPLQLEIQVGAMRPELAHFRLLSVRIEAEGMIAGDTLSVLLNGRPVPVSPGMDKEKELGGPISHKDLQHGSNRVSLTFRPADGGDRTITIHAVEIHVRK